MKLSAVTNRGTKKDFVDLHFLLRQFSLQQMLGFYADKFSDTVIFPVLKSLVYFDDAENDPMPRMLIPCLWAEAKEKIMQAVK